MVFSRYLGNGRQTLRVRMIGRHGGEDKNTPLLSEQHKEDHVVVRSGSSLVEVQTLRETERKGLPGSSTIQGELSSCMLGVAQNCGLVL